MRNKEKVVVSSEVKIILYDLFNQIQYELIEQYEEFRKENEKLRNIIQDAHDKLTIKHIRLINEPNYVIGHSDLNEIIELLEEDADGSNK